MPKRRAFYSADYVIKPKRKNKGIHSKNRHTTNKNGKYYTGTKNGCKRYRGEGR